MYGSVGNNVQTAEPNVILRKPKYKKRKGDDMPRDRAQCLITKGSRILLLTHLISDHEWFCCLPGGGIELDETPEEAAIRELEEECNVSGQIIRMTSQNDYGDLGKVYTFNIDIGDSEPTMGPHAAKYMIDLRWLKLREIPERDRCFLWAAGLIGVPGMREEIMEWGDAISYPQ
jgi:8-oxo-dGTP pyrophosphatase MutT (NUDIX family)